MRWRANPPRPPPARTAPVARTNAPAPSPSPLIALGRAMSSVVANLTLYAAPCLSSGATVAALHELLRLDLVTGFTLGFFAAVGPVYLFYASDWGMQRTLNRIRQWEAAGLIDQTQARRLRDRAIAWYSKRRF